MENTKPFIITISRQLGSGGAYIGQHLAKKMDMFYADREIINQAAKAFSVLEKDLETRDEKISSFWESYAQTFKFGIPEIYIPPEFIPTDSELFIAEAKIIEHIAARSSAVIVGRCGSYILREHPDHVSIFLHADIAFRKSRIQKLYHISEEAAGEMITKSDKERSLYCHTYTGIEWTDARQYTFCLDTGKIGLSKSVDFILK